MTKKIVSFFIIFIFLSAVMFAAETRDQEQKVPYSNYFNNNVLSIVASFDGSYSITRWHEILDFAKVKNVKFTFFISGVYLISNKHRNQYIYPIDKRKGISNIGFGGASTDVVTRISLIQQALKEGHDIESHLNGHFNGLHWTENEWMMEFEQFNKFSTVLPITVHHVRFPLLTRNNNVLPAMAEYKIYSISSDVEDDSRNVNKYFNRVTFAYKNKPYTILEFPMTWHHYKNGSHIPMMDYNFYLRDKKHHRGYEEAKRNMIADYLDEADTCFKEHRPFFINHHFENLDDGAYWEAMKEVITILQKKYKVDFLTIDGLYKKVSVDK